VLPPITVTFTAGLVPVPPIAVALPLVWVHCGTLAPPVAPPVAVQVALAGGGMGGGGRLRIVGFAFVGSRLVGWDLVGLALVGLALALVGLALVGLARVGFRLVGFVRVGRERCVGLLLVGLALASVLTLLCNRKLLARGASVLSSRKALRAVANPPAPEATSAGATSGTRPSSGFKASTPFGSPALSARVRSSCCELSSASAGAVASCSAGGGGKGGKGRSCCRSSGCAASDHKASVGGASPPFQSMLL